MAKTFEPVESSSWDGDPAAEPIRLIHLGNQITISTPIIFVNSVVTYNQHTGIPCSAIAQAVWDGTNGSPWKRKTVKIGTRKAKMYLKGGVMLPDALDNLTEHVVVMFAIDLKLFGGLLEVSHNGHTGQWY